MEIRLKSYHKIYTTLPQIHLPARCFHWLICSWSIQQTPPRELVLAYHHQPHCTPILFLRGGRFYQILCKKNYRRLVLIKNESSRSSLIVPSSQGTQFFPRSHDCDKCSKSILSDNSAQNLPSFSLHFLVDFLRRLHGAFAQCWRARQRNVFLEKIVFLRFSYFIIYLFSFIIVFKVAKSLQKATSNVRTIVCSSKYYEDDFRY